MAIGRFYTGGRGGTVSVTFRINDKQVQQMLRSAVGALGRDKVATWFRRTADPHMRDKTFRQSFTSETSPRGEKWDALAESTRKSRTRAGLSPVGPKLRRKAYTLYNAVLKTKGEMTGGYSMRWGHNITGRRAGLLYKVHQAGATVGKGAKVPARPMIGFARKDPDWMARSLLRWIFANIKGGSVSTMGF